MARMTEVETAVKPYEPVLVEAVEEAGRRTRELCENLPPGANIRTRRNIMYDFIADELRQRVQELPDTEFLGESQNFFLRIRTIPCVVLRFNYGNGGLGYATNPTLFTRDYDGQYELTGMEAGVNLRLLYLTDELDREVTGVRIICPSATGEAEWAYDLDRPTTSNVADLHSDAAPTAAPLRPKKGLKRKRNVG